MQRIPMGRRRLILLSAAMRRQRTRSPDRTPANARNGFTRRTIHRPMKCSYTLGSVARNGGTGCSSRSSSTRSQDAPYGEALPRNGLGQGFVSLITIRQYDPWLPTAGPEVDGRSHPGCIVKRPRTNDSDHARHLRGPPLAFHRSICRSSGKLADA
jgi:hypothetical protein